MDLLTDTDFWKALLVMAAVTPAIWGWWSMVLDDCKKGENEENPWKI